MSEGPSVAELRIEFCDELEAERVLKAIAPDNEPLPRGLRVEMRQEGKQLLVLVECSRGTDSLLATVDDVLSAIHLAERVICARSQFRT
ncbi:MAG: KEOPS complex subunit Pcc1 [Aigarchaeota archaeon]|nr:KEOPS complex subunit Pcc1 [Aigarchaeota archaeon]MCS7118299.1 KEOPS complex subunit Pcc1 [Candidatus Calditenuaceae archaeon]MDW8042070.1 KEOPS complex subunit Pcc1 [Nitrososphaerota archaeon]